MYNDTDNFLVYGGIKFREGLSNHASVRVKQAETFRRSRGALCEPMFRHQQLLPR
jgi:hypothetical protein